MLDAQRAAADSAASKAAAASKPSAVDAALKAAGKAGSVAGSMNSAAAEGGGGGRAKKNPLDHAVQLLAGMRCATALKECSQHLLGFLWYDQSHSVHQQQQQGFFQCGVLSKQRKHFG